MNRSPSTGHEFEPPRKTAQSPHQVQLIFVGALLLVVLSVVAEYVMGDFVGRNVGQDLGLIVGGTMVAGVCVGLVVAAFHSWSRHSKHR